MIKNDPLLPKAFNNYIHPKLSWRNLLDQLGILDRIDELDSLKLSPLTGDEKKILRSIFDRKVSYHDEHTDLETTLGEIENFLNDTVTLKAVVFSGSGPLKLIASTLFPRWLDEIYSHLHGKSLVIDEKLEEAFKSFYEVYCVETDYDIHNHYRDPMGSAFRAHLIMASFLQEKATSSDPTLYSKLIDGSIFPWVPPRGDSEAKFGLNGFTEAKIDLMHVEKLPRASIHTSGSLKFNVITLLKGNVEEEIAAHPRKCARAFIDILLGNIRHTEAERPEEKQHLEGSDLLKLAYKLVRGDTDKNPELIPRLINAFCKEKRDLVTWIKRTFEDHLPQESDFGAALVLQFIVLLQTHTEYDDRKLVEIVTKTEDIWNGSAVDELLSLIVMGSPQVILFVLSYLNIIGAIQRCPEVEKGVLQLQIGKAYLSIPHHLELSLLTYLNCEKLQNGCPFILTDMFSQHLLLEAVQSAVNPFLLWSKLYSLGSDTEMMTEFSLKICERLLRKKQVSLCHEVWSQHQKRFGWKSVQDEKSYCSILCHILNLMIEESKLTSAKVFLVETFLPSKVPVEIKIKAFKKFLQQCTFEDSEDLISYTKVLIETVSRNQVNLIIDCILEIYPVKHALESIIWAHSSSMHKIKKRTSRKVMTYCFQNLEHIDAVAQFYFFAFERDLWESAKGQNEYQVLSGRVFQHLYSSSTEDTERLQSLIKEFDPFLKSKKMSPIRKATAAAQIAYLRSHIEVVQSGRIPKIHSCCLTKKELIEFRACRFRALFEAGTLKEALNFYLKYLKGVSQDQHASVTTKFMEALKRDSSGSIEIALSKQFAQLCRLAKTSPIPLHLELFLQSESLDNDLLSSLLAYFKAERNALTFPFLLELSKKCQTLRCDQMSDKSRTLLCFLFPHILTICQGITKAVDILESLFKFVSVHEVKKNSEGIMAILLDDCGDIKTKISIFKVLQNRKAPIPAESKRQFCLSVSKFFRYRNCSESLQWIKRAGVVNEDDRLLLEAIYQSHPHRGEVSFLKTCIESLKLENVEKVFQIFSDNYLPKRTTNPNADFRALFQLPKCHERDQCIYRLIQYLASKSAALPKDIQRALISFVLENNMTPLTSTGSLYVYLTKQFQCATPEEMRLMYQRFPSMTKEIDGPSLCKGLYTLLVVTISQNKTTDVEILNTLFKIYHELLIPKVKDRNDKYFHLVGLILAGASIRLCPEDRDLSRALGAISNAIRCSSADFSRMDKDYGCLRNIPEDQIEIMIHQRIDDLDKRLIMYSYFVLGLVMYHIQGHPEGDRELDPAVPQALLNILQTKGILFRIDNPGLQALLSLLQRVYPRDNPRGLLNIALIAMKRYGSLTPGHAPTKAKEFVYFAFTHFLESENFDDILIQRLAKVKGFATFFKDNHSLAFRIIHQLLVLQETTGFIPARNLLQAVDPKHSSENGMIYHLWLTFLESRKLNSKLLVAMNDYNLLLEQGRIPKECSDIHKAAIPQLAICLFPSDDFKKYHNIFHLLQNESSFHQHLELFIKELLEGPNLTKFLDHESSADILTTLLSEMLHHLKNQTIPYETGVHRLLDLLLVLLLIQKPEDGHSKEINQLLSLEGSLEPDEEFYSQLLFLYQLLNGQRFDTSILTTKSLQKLMIRSLTIADYRAINLVLFIFAAKCEEWKEDPNFDILLNTLAKISARYLSLDQVKTAHEHMSSLIERTDQTLTSSEMTTQLLHILHEILTRMGKGESFFWNYYVYCVAKLNPETDQDLFFEQFSLINKLRSDDIPSSILTPLIETTVAVANQDSFAITRKRLEMIDLIAFQSAICYDTPKPLLDHFDSLYHSLKLKGAQEVAPREFYGIASYTRSPGQLLELGASSNLIVDLLLDKCSSFLFKPNLRIFSIGLYYMGQFNQFVDKHSDDVDESSIAKVFALLASSIATTFSDDMIDHIKLRDLPQHLAKIEKALQHYPDALTNPFNVTAALQTLNETMIQLKYQDTTASNFIRDVYLGALEFWFLTVAPKNYDVTLQLWYSGIEMFGGYHQTPPRKGGTLEGHPYVELLLLPFHEDILKSKETTYFSLALLKLHSVLELLMSKQPKVHLAIKKKCILNLFHTMSQQESRFAHCEEESRKLVKLLKNYFRRIEKRK